MTAAGGRRLAAVAVASVLATGLLAASAGTVGATAGGGSGGSSLDAHGSVEEVYVLDATAGRAGAPRDATGDTVATKQVDDEGSVLFENVKPGSGYTVVAGSGKGSTSKPVRVLAPDDHPQQSFYDGQTLDPGSTTSTTRDGTTLAATVSLPGPVEDGPYPTVIEYSGYDPANPDGPQPSTLIARRARLRDGRREHARHRLLGRRVRLLRDSCSRSTATTSSRPSPPSRG